MIDRSLTLKFRKESPGESPELLLPSRAATGLEMAHQQGFLPASGAVWTALL
jgi:hypothetical protein